MEFPKISYHIFYAYHTTAKDCEELVKVFKGTDFDIYIPEASGWSNQLLRIFNKISQGELTARKAAPKCNVSQRSSRFKELQIVEGSKKPILIIDVPLGHRLAKAGIKLRELGHRFKDLFLLGDFQSALRFAREFVKFLSYYALEREAVLRDNLKQEVKRLIETSSNLRNKQEINVLLKLGAFHTRIYHCLKAEKLSVFWYFSRQPLAFFSVNEASRRIVFFKNKDIKDITDKFLARGILELVLDDYIIQKTDDSNKAVMLARKISLRLKLKDIEEISKELGGDRRKTVAGCLRRRGIRIPKTEKEINEMLKIKK